MLDIQYLTGSGSVGGHSAISYTCGRLPSQLRGMSRLAGRMRSARKCERILACRLPAVVRVPRRQVSCRTWLCPAARMRSLNVTGGSWYAGLGGRPPAGVGRGQRDRVGGLGARVGVGLDYVGQATLGQVGHSFGEIWGPAASSSLRNPVKSGASACAAGCPRRMWSATVPASTGSRAINA